jgi:sugar phosphate isomerase/epimerase
MRAGLVSVTFRKLSPEAVARAAAENGLSCIEWGGDIHVPHGELETARDVGRLTRDHGLDVSAYGSYYVLAQSEKQGLAFESVLETALALGAPTIRVWPGRKGSAEADADYRESVESDALRAADLAGKAGVTVGYEFHGGSLTDTATSARALLDATGHPAIRAFWQPPVGYSVEECLAGLEQILDRLGHVHAFHWWPDSDCRLPLSEGAERWKQYLVRIKQAGKAPDVLLEFVPGDDIAILTQEARTLCGWLESLAG